MEGLEIRGGVRTMGKQVRVQDQEVRVDEEMTVGELKEEMDVSESDCPTMKENGSRPEFLSEKDKLSELPDGADIKFLPVGGKLFG